MPRLIYSTALILTVYAFAAAIHAHSSLLSSKPGAGESAAASPARVELVFSVRVQPAMSSISLTGPGGTRMTSGPLQAAPDGKTVWVDLEDPLPPGEYKVEWRALSADDHTIKGDFAFSVLSPVDRSSFADQPRPVAQEQDHSMMDHSGRSREAGLSWPESIGRWLAYLGIALFAGGIAFRLFVAAPAAGTADELAAFDNVALKVVAPAAALFLFASTAALALQTVSLFDAFSFSAAIKVIGETTFGPPWAVQMAAAALGIIFILVASRTEVAFRTKWFWAAFAAALILFIASGFTGHARAASAEYILAIPADWLHIAAATVWVGGLLMLVTAVPRAGAVLGGEKKLAAYSEYISRFNKLAVVSVLLIALTGIYNSYIHVDSFAALLGTTYGQLLIAKAALSLLMVIIGGLNAYVVHPRIRSGAGGSENALLRNVKLEVALSVTVLLLAALLAFMPPAREHLPVTATQSMPHERSLV